MDSGRFDELSRSLARTATRRRVVGVLLGGLAPLVGRRPGVGARCAQRCGAGQVMASGCRCLCRATGRPPVDGRCPCSAGQVSCGGRCVDPARDPANCGGCGVVCDSGVCRSGGCLLAVGAVSEAPSACASGVMADGVCCDRPCDGAGNCVFPASGTPCGETTCRDGRQIDLVCDGAGNCQERPTDCGLFVCGADARCLTTCASDGDCLGEAHCVGVVCAGDMENGEPCERPDQCVSGHCVADVCCNNACDGPCLTCATGTCSVGEDFCA